MSGTAEFLRKSLEGEYGIGDDEERPGTVWHYHMPGGLEMGVYPLLYGEGRLYVGRKSHDAWDRAFDYQTIDEAVEAAKGWFDIWGDPPGDWIRQHDRSD